MLYLPVKRNKDGQAESDTICATIHSTNAALSVVHSILSTLYSSLSTRIKSLSEHQMVTVIASASDASSSRAGRLRQPHVARCTRSLALLAMTAGPWVFG